MYSTSRTLCTKERVRKVYAKQENILKGTIGNWLNKLGFICTKLTLSTY